jgi:selenide,water dikinase
MATATKISPTLAVLQSVELISPPVDDPFAAGAIAATHALAALWAGGGRPLFAIHLLELGSDANPRLEKALLAGGEAGARSAGVPITGLHRCATAGKGSRYGLAATGGVHPQRVIGTQGARDGDLLLLTKPLGTGMAVEAIHRKKASRRLIALATSQMLTSAQAAGEVLSSRRFQVNALTAVGEAGLLAAALGLTAKGARVRLSLEQIPLLEGVPALAAEGLCSARTEANLKAAARSVRFPQGLPADIQRVLADVQVSGGLLAAVPAKQVRLALSQLSRAEVDAAVVGEVVKGPSGVEVV